jgi:predicted permease
MVAILARYAARFSVRALDLTVDASLLWVGAALAIAAAVFLAFVPRLPSASASHGFGLAIASQRLTGSAGRRQRMFAVTQIAASFLLLAGASMLLKTLIALETTATGLDTGHVLAINVPVIACGRTPDQIVGFYKESIRRIRELPGVDEVAVGTATPWRDARSFSFALAFTADGQVRGKGEEDPRARIRFISQGFFAALGVPIIAGRDFNDSDRRGGERVVIVRQSLAKRIFPNQDAVNRHMMWTDPVIQFIAMSGEARRIVGVAADIDDENVVPGPAVTAYLPFAQEQLWGGRLFVHEHGNPYALVTPITRIIRSIAADQPVEHAATLEDIRAEVLTPDRLNTLVFGVFAGVALAIAVVGVAGVLAFSVSGRTREFGIRMAVGSQPQQIVAGVIAEGLVIAAAGVAAGAICGLGLGHLAAGYFHDLREPSAMPVLCSVAVLLTAAIVASVLPAQRASRVDIVQALRAD